VQLPNHFEKDCDYNIDTLILFAFNLFKLHYLLQLLIIIIVAMENTIADPSMENWVHSHSSSLSHIRSASYSWSTL
jgi:hypothetical protein